MLQQIAERKYEISFCSIVGNQEVTRELRRKFAYATRQRKIRTVHVGSGEDKQRNVQQTSAKAISSDKIAKRAYSIWEREGRPEGRESEFWFRAEAELKSDQSAHLKF